MHQNYWPARARVRCSSASIMLGNALPEVPGNAGIERLVRAPDNVDIPLCVRLSAHRTITPLGRMALGSLAEVGDQAKPWARIRAILAVWGRR